MKLVTNPVYANYYFSNPIASRATVTPTLTYQSLPWTPHVLRMGAGKASQASD